MNVGYIGLGVMGSSMAEHLIKGGHTVRIHNRNRSKEVPLAQLGGISCESPVVCAAEVDAMFLCLNDGNSVKEVLFGENGAAKGLKPGVVVADFSTIAPAEAVKIATTLQQQGVSFVDSPVTGGDVGAKNATLTIMCGGEIAAVEKIRPLLELLGKKIIRVGDSGAGQKTKSVNQIACAINNASMTETMALAHNMGLDLQTTLEIIGSGAGGSWAINNYSPRILRGEYGPGFYQRHMLKDLKIALKEAQTAGIELPMTKLATSLFEQMSEEVFDGVKGSEFGNHALAKLYERRFGALPLPKI